MAILHAASLVDLTRLHAIDATSHVWTTPRWQGLLHRHEELVGSAHLSRLFARREHR